jgi:hypothetical protein
MMIADAIAGEAMRAGITNTTTNETNPKDLRSISTIRSETISSSDRPLLPPRPLPLPHLNQRSKHMLLLHRCTRSLLIWGNTHHSQPL